MFTAGYIYTVSECQKHVIDMHVIISCTQYCSTKATMIKHTTESITSFQITMKTVTTFEVFHSKT